VRKYSFLFYLFVFFSLAACKLQLFARSVLRPNHKKIPSIETEWVHSEGPTYLLRNSHLEEYPLFKTFNKEFFYANILPTEEISYRYDPAKTVEGAELKRMINNLIKEIEQRMRRYTDFIILRKRDFNRRRKSGLLILKNKHYPFVVKIFMETPKTFIKHNSKGVIPIFFFYMAGGINRHLLGFTRIKNLQDMQTRLSQSPTWTELVTMPRKWFMLPEKTDWIKITGTNIGGKKKQEIKIPGTYCVISDFVDSERRTSVFNGEDRKICMELCNYLELAIDPHIDNFMIERNTKKIAIVDTEHFLSVVGMKKKKRFTSYFSWGLYLADSCFRAMFLRTKKKRKKVQTEKSETELCYQTSTYESPAQYT